MKNKNLLSALLCMSLSFFLFPSCRTMASVTTGITVESGEIPPDMKKEKFILVGILTGKSAYDKYVEKEFAGYTGSYVLASKEELDKRYKDTEKYRYVIDVRRERHEGNSAAGTTATYGARYIITDRKTGLTYERKTASSNVGWELRASLTAIDKERKK